MTAPPPRRGLALNGILAVAATTSYFLLYAQFGFLARIRQCGADPQVIPQAMGLMGAGGLLASFGAAWLLARLPARRLLLAGFAGCAAAALLTLVGSSPALFFTAAFLIGAFTGVLTVTLAASLRAIIRGPAFATQVGAGTGLAYLVCNIPAVFGGTPAWQALFSAAVCGLGVVAVARMPTPASPSPAGTSPATRRADSYRGANVLALVAMLFALVALDSTAFATIQNTPALKALTWGSPGLKLMLGVVHAAAAVLAGWLIDRGACRRLLLATLGLFAVAFAWLQSGGGAAWAAGPLYAIGISTYSVVLIALPSLHPEEPGLIPVRWRSALLYAVAGWIGSALGVVLAQRLHAIPGALVLAAAVLVGGGSMIPFTPIHLRLARDYQMLLPFALLALLAASGFFHLPVPPASADPAAIVARGRRVYIQEGCIHCHSQVVRPHTADALNWGPFHPVDYAERPPMVGNRRQGPDLMNVGLRRGAVWQRQHLLQPTSVSPGSRMPSYAALFRSGDSRGSDLVAYLGNLGAGRGPERAAAIAAWAPHAGAQPPSPSAGAATFEQLCAVCHGPSARGNGPTAAAFQQPAMNLRKGPYLHIPAGLNAADETVALARLVKFGVTGLNMPGHETLPDDAILDVVAYSRLLNHRHTP